MFIKTPQQLKEAIPRALDNVQDVLLAIADYKWYNYYQNIHIKMGSEEDKQNEILFTELALKYPDLHKKIEDRIDEKIDFLNSDLADLD